jgi:hypothetical protein
MLSEKTRDDDRRASILALPPVSIVKAKQLMKEYTMSQVARKSKASPFARFRTRDPNVSRVFLDVGRAEIMLNMIVLPDLGRGAQFDEFVSSVHAASNGDPAVLALLLKAFDQWHKIDKAFEAKVRRTWNRTTLIDTSAITILRRTCTGQRVPLPPSMVHAIFDDASFDFVAYLAWHNG